MAHQGHKASKWQSWDLNPHSLTSEHVPLNYTASISELEFIKGNYHSSGGRQKVVEPAFSLQESPLPKILPYTPKTPLGVRSLLLARRHYNLTQVSPQGIKKKQQPKSA